jgi:hypothetical protein
MSPRFFTETSALDSVSNASRGGSLPQREPGEKRVQAAKSGFGTTVATSSTAPQHDAPHLKVVRTARIVSEKGRLVVVKGK